MEHQSELLRTEPVFEKRQPESGRTSEYSASNVEPGSEVEYGPASFDAASQSRPEFIRPADFNRLFVRPETFNGVRPPPRQWLDQYEKAAISNGWSDTAKVKYMATFLKETAYAWLTDVAPLHISNEVKWDGLKNLFVRCYLVESDRQAAKRELDRAIQREDEKASQFIPKMLQMIRTLDPDRKQDVLTDDIRHKLLPEYQIKN